MSTPSSPARTALQQAIYHHRRGRLKEAETFYRLVLRTHPGHPEAGRNLLGAMFLSGRYGDMEAAAAEMLAAAPDFGLAWKGLGLAQLMQGKDGLQAFRTAAAHLSDDAEPHYYLGLALYRAGQPEAAECLRRAIKLNPAFPGAHAYLGNILRDQGKLDAAVAHYRRALELRPDLAEAHSNLGSVLRDQGRMEEALAAYRRALDLRPDLAEAHNNLGRLLKDLGRFADAESSLRRALECRPDFVAAHHNLASVLRDQGRMEEARAAFERLATLAPDDAAMRMARASGCLPLLPRNQEEASAAPARFAAALNELAQWMRSAQSRPVDPSRLQLPFCLAYRAGNHVSLLSRFGDLLAQPGAAGPARAQGRGKIRLAIASSRFLHHPVWEIHLKGLLQQLDRTRFELVLYHLDHAEDEETALARSLADIWRDARTVCGVNGWLEAFAADRPDAVFYPELGVEPLAYSLACRRLAPVQTAGWGHPLTSGLPTIDLYFSGLLLEPAHAEAHYRERLVRLPGTGCCTAPLARAPQAVPALQAQLRGRRGARFLVAQMPFKIDPAADELLADIAAAVGDCVFMLPTHPQFPWATGRLVGRMSRALARRGLGPERHLQVIPWLSQEKFLGLLDLCDICLDCPAFSGYSTARLAIQRGIPVVTLEGPQLRQRLAAGLLQHIGIEDTIAASREEYVAIASMLARECGDAVARNRRRERLRLAASLADNDVRVVRAFEQSLAEALAASAPPALPSRSPRSSA